MLKTCQYADCLEDIGDKGVTITLKTPDSYDDKRAGYCCVAHAVVALSRLALDRHETVPEIPKLWKVT